MAPRLALILGHNGSLASMIDQTTQLTTRHTIAHVITHAWVSAGGTGAQNYDEFATDDEVTAAIEANSTSVLAIEMPHRAPKSVSAGADFPDSLEFAAARLRQLRASGQLTPVDDVVAIYRINRMTSAGDGFSYGLFCMVDTDQISGSADQPGRIIRNEDVFLEKVRERVALTKRLHSLLSAVLLLQADNGENLYAALAQVSAGLGEPAVVDQDQHGAEHAVWLLGPGALRDELLTLAGSGELIVADGNHRSLAAQQGGLARFLAVITTPQSVDIKPYHRLVRKLDGLKMGDVLTGLTRSGARVSEANSPGFSGDFALPAQGSVLLRARGRSYFVRLPEFAASSAHTLVDRLDHAVVERVLFGDVLHMEPDDKRITYVGGDYPIQWLIDQVDSGAADLAVLIPPVSVDDFVAVNKARLKMPRKSTWFTPKARAGLICADV